MKKIVSAKANDDFTLILEFNNGAIKKFDVKPYLEIGIFRELKDPNYFKNFRLVFGTVQWNNEQDFSPDTLYLEGVSVSENEFSNNLEKVL
jgi:hypothetical protein